MDDRQPAALSLHTLDTVSVARTRILAVYITFIRQICSSPTCSAQFDQLPRSAWTDRPLCSHLLSRSHRYDLVHSTDRLSRVGGRRDRSAKGTSSPWVRSPLFHPGTRHSRWKCAHGFSARSLKLLCAPVFPSITEGSHPGPGNSTPPQETIVVEVHDLRSETHR